MNELFFKDVFNNSSQRDDLFNDEAIQFITDRINAMVDVPFINEEVERIIIQAIIKILYNLLLSNKSLVTKG